MVRIDVKPESLEALPPRAGVPSERGGNEPGTVRFDTVADDAKWHATAYCRDIAVTRCQRNAGGGELENRFQSRCPSTPSGMGGDHNPDVSSGFRDSGPNCRQILHKLCRDLHNFVRCGVPD
jgi:hypothetical protein